MMANCRIVGAWNSVAIDSCFPNNCSILTSSFATNRESPPKSKKLSVMLTGLTLKSSVQTAASMDSLAVRWRDEFLP